MTRLILDMGDPWWTPEMVMQQMEAWLETSDAIDTAKQTRDWAGENLAMEQRANLADELIETAVLYGTWRVEERRNSFWQRVRRLLDAPPEFDGRILG